MPDVIISLINLIAVNILNINPQISTAVLGVIVLVLILFIRYRAPQLAESTDPAHRNKQAPVEAGDEATQIARLNNEILEREREISRLRSNPDFSSLEHFYFNFNGIINAAFVLATAFLIIEYWTLQQRTQSLIEAIGAIPQEVVKNSSLAMNSVEAIQADVSILMAALTVTLVISALVVSLARLRRGKSFAIINRAFQLSLLVAIIILLAVILVFLYARG